MIRRRDYRLDKTNFFSKKTSAASMVIPSSNVAWNNIRFVLQEILWASLYWRRVQDKIREVIRRPGSLTDVRNYEGKEDFGFYNMTNLFTYPLTPTRTLSIVFQISLNIVKICTIDNSLLILFIDSFDTLTHFRNFNDHHINLLLQNTEHSPQDTICHRELFKLFSNFITLNKISYIHINPYKNCIVFLPEI